jgi:hypothetical protein
MGRSTPSITTSDRSNTSIQRGKIFMIDDWVVVTPIK